MDKTENDVFDSSNNSPADSLASSNCALTFKSNSKMKKPLIPVRAVISFLSTTSVFLMFYMRLNLSVAIVAMVKPHVHNDSLEGASSDFVPHDDTCYPDDYLESLKQNSSASTKLAGTIDWDEGAQGIVLGAYFYGYALTQIVGGRLAERFGAKWPNGIAMAVSVVCTFLTPVASVDNIVWIVTLRVIMGLFQGIFLSSAYTLLAEWVPIQERPTALGFVVSGGTLGSIVAMFVTALLCEVQWLNGWPLAFYLPGTLGLVWVFAWFVYVTNKPVQHKFISLYELNYIRKHIGESKPKKAQKVPWCPMITSIRVWALIINKAFGSFGYFVLSTKLPAYLENVLKMDMTNNGIINSLVYVALFLGNPLGGPMSSLLKRKTSLSMTTIRKIFTTIAYSGPSIALALIPLAGCNGKIVNVLVVASLSTLGFYTGGDIPMFAEMAPSFSGTLFGIANTCASAVGFITPFVLGLILEGRPDSKSAWNIAFFLSSGLAFAGIIIFDLFATAEQQPWGKAECLDEKAEEGKVSQIYSGKDIEKESSYKKHSDSIISVVYNDKY